VNGLHHARLHRLPRDVHSRSAPLGVIDLESDRLASLKLSNELLSPNSGRLGRTPDADENSREGRMQDALWALATGASLRWPVIGYTEDLDR